MKWTIIIVVCGIFTVLIYNKYFKGGGSHDPNLNFQTSFNPASSSGKNQLLIFTADWCPPCRQMKAHVYNDPQVEPLKEQLDWTFFDVDNAQVKPIAAQFNIRGIPAFIVVDRNGNEISRASGGMQPAEFAAFLNATL